MVRILIVAAQPTALADFAAYLIKDRKVEVCRATTGREALELIGQGFINAVVVDEMLADGPAMAFVRQVTKLQPLINCAMVSSLAPEDFHEATEGLGVFMQLPVGAGAKEAEIFLQMLETIEDLMTL